MELLHFHKKTYNAQRTADLGMFGHFFHLLFGFWDRNRNHVGAGQSREPGSHGVDHLIQNQRQEKLNKSVERETFTKSTSIQAGSAQWQDEAGCDCRKNFFFGKTKKNLSERKPPRALITGRGQQEKKKKKKLLWSFIQSSPASTILPARLYWTILV